MESSSPLDDCILAQVAWDRAAVTLTEKMVLDWQPVASMSRLRARARLLAEIRGFFAERGVMEVETPLLVAAIAPESHLEPISSDYLGGRYLQSSPETAMKRLLAAGSGPIYQVTRAFRADERGALHNPEFTMLEWYRPGWGYERLMQEVAGLVDRATGCGQPRIWTLREAFQQLIGEDPWQADWSPATVASAEDAPSLAETDWLGWLDWLMASRLEPAMKKQKLGGVKGGAVILKNFPPERAAMAEVDPGPPAFAKRFEFYLNGVELANGYQELTDAKEQAARFTRVNEERQAAARSSLAVDGRFLAALAHGLPPCAGVALGVDRLLMAMTGAREIGEVLAFPFESC